MLIEDVVGLGNFTDHIFSDCSDYVRLLHNGHPPLYRGVRTFTNQYYENLNPLANRELKDDHPYVDRITDEYLGKNGFASRTKSWFATSNQLIASDYGNLYYAFPTNGTKFTYIKGKADLHLDLEKWLRHDALDILEGARLGNGRLADIIHDTRGDLGTFSVYVKHSPQVKTFLSRFYIAKLPFKNDNLGFALDSAKEIWFEGRYHLLKVNDIGKTIMHKITY